MKSAVLPSFAAQLKAHREAASFTQEELATIAGLSVHAISALERGERRRPQVETVRALSAALDLTGAAREALVESARASTESPAIDEPSSLLLPRALTNLIGRDADAQRLRQWLANPAARLITLTGPGGVGKTRLALEVAQAIADGRTVRVVFVRLDAIRDPEFVAAAIAEALGLSDVAAANLPRRARSACGDRRTLLLLDNFEQVLDATPLIAELLTSVPAFRVLVTSRAPLRVRGEREYALGPLTLHVDDDVAVPADLARAPAVRLFLERARDVQPDFRLTSANAATVTAICRRLDALPLGIELAAPWIKVLTAEDLLQRLTDDVLFSTVGPRDLPERQQTINATVAWSYQLLAPADRRAFRRLGTLPGRFPVEAAAAVLDGRDESPAGAAEALGAVAGLIDKSLVLRAATTAAARPLYRMLETVRAYAALELASVGERDDALEGLVRYSAREAVLTAEGLAGPAQIEWLDRAREDLESHRTVLALLIERNRAAEAADIAWALLWFWGIRGHASEGLHWYEQILAMPDIPPSAESRALLGAAAMSFVKGELVRARSFVTRALAAATGIGDRAIMVQAENVFGHIEHGDGNVAAARDRFTRAVEGFQSLGIPWGAGNALSGLAQVALAAGDGDEAERLLVQAVASLRPAGPWFFALAEYVRAVLAVRRGKANEAIAIVGKSLANLRECQDRFGFVYALVPLAAAAVLKGDDARAARILGARDAVTERSGATVADHAVRDLEEQVERDARARLGPERWKRAYAAGLKTSIDQLLEDIDGARVSPSGSTAG